MTDQELLNGLFVDGDLKGKDENQNFIRSSQNLPQVQCQDTKMLNV